VGRVLSEAQIAALATLASTPIAERFYLAGGTALAVLLGHRESVDLDFFSESPFDPTLEIRPLPSTNWSVASIEPSTAHLWYRSSTGDSVKVSLLGYPYPILRPFHSGKAPLDPRIRLASIEDIVAMKLSAIGSRGSRRDFVDLFFAMKANGLSLQGALSLFAEKFQGTHVDQYHFARALSYFQDAEREPAPKMLVDLDWESVKREFESAARTLILGP
jgi:hypothetical protein